LVSFVDAVGETRDTYDADGNLVRQVNVNGTVELISYDGAGVANKVTAMMMSQNFQPDFPLTFPMPLRTDTEI
jgi:YD repeat-containing protein